MPEPTADLLSPQWRHVAAAVDAYESQCSNDFPDLRPFALIAGSAYEMAALIELVKVDLERHWTLEQPKTIEQYLNEYVQLRDSTVSLEELVRHEWNVRTRYHKNPCVDDFCRRFPELNKDCLLRPEQSAIIVRIGQAEPEKRPAAAPLTSAPTLDGQMGMPPDNRGTEIGVDPWSTRQPADGTPHGANGADTRGRGSSRTRPAVDRFAKSALAPPETIGRYLVKEKLGSGGFGDVFRCYDKDLACDVAIKVPRKRLSSSVSQTRAFLHEAQSAARLDHPCIVKVLTVDRTEDGRVYVVYNLIEGETLWDRLQLGEFTHQQAAEWVANIADALHYAHKKGVFHRDVKPKNILFNKEGRPHLADFGLAKLDDRFYADDTGGLLGSFGYMSPEQAARKPEWATPQVDIYSLGVVLYELLCRKPPFTRSRNEEGLREIIERAPTPPRTIDDTIPRPLEAVCLKAMRKDPADRYTTASDMAADLRKGLAQRGVSRRYALRVLGAAALGTVVFWRSDPISPRSLGPAPLTIPRGTLQFKIHYQTPGQTNHHRRWWSLGSEKLALYDGYRLQFHIALHGQAKYVYVYWYDQNGRAEPHEGVPQPLWPVDRTQQQPVNQAVLPEQPEPARAADLTDEDHWYELGGGPGAEMLLVAFAAEPVSSATLEEFATFSAFVDNAADVTLRNVVRFGSDELESELRERSLMATVQSPKYLLTTEFRQSLNDMFQGFYGVIIPHR